MWSLKLQGFINLLFCLNSDQFDEPQLKKGVTGDLKKEPLTRDPIHSGHQQ